MFVVNVWFLEDGFAPLVIVVFGGSCARCEVVLSSAFVSAPALKPVEDEVDAAVAIVGSLLSSLMDCGMNSLVLLGLQLAALALNELVLIFGMLFQGDDDTDVLVVVPTRELVLDAIPIPLLLPLPRTLKLPQAEADPVFWLRSTDDVAGRDVDLFMDIFVVDDANPSPGFHSFAVVESFPSESARSSIVLCYSLTIFAFLC